MKQPVAVLLLLIALLWAGPGWAQTRLGVVRYNHVTLPVKDLTVSIQFYTNAIGLQLVAVPSALANSQAWFAIGGGQQLRLTVGRTEPATTTATTMHIALVVSSLRQAEQQLRLHNVAVSRQTDASAKPRLLINDPDGYQIELDEGKAESPGFLQSAAKSIWKSITTVE